MARLTETCDERKRHFKRVILQSAEPDSPSRFTDAEIMPIRGKSRDHPEFGRCDPRFLPPTESNQTDNSDQYNSPDILIPILIVCSVHLRYRIQ